MLIDLHCHTKAVKKGETSGRDVDPDFIVKKILECNLGVVAITNHNCFDLEQFRKIKKALINKCQVWPGIELDCIDRNHSPFHCIVVANPNKVEEFYQFVGRTINTKVDDFTISIENLIDVTNALDCFYIFHFHQKEPSIDEKELEYFKSKTNRSTRVLVETKNFTTWKVLRNNNFNVIWGSDVVDWNKYEKTNFFNTALSFCSFENFVLFLDNNNQIFMDLSDYGKEETQVFGDTSTQSYVHKLDVYPGVNIIFGGRGSGKTEALISLKNHYDKYKKKVFYYESKSSEDLCNDFKNVKDSDYVTENFGLENNLNDVFFEIQNFKKDPPTSFLDYKNWASNSINNLNKEKFKSINLPIFHNVSDIKLKQILTDLTSLTKFKEKITRQNLFANFEAERKELFLIINSLIDKIKASSKNEWINFYSRTMFNNYISKMRYNVSSCVGSSPMPIKTGFHNFVSQVIHFNLLCQKLNSLFKNEPKIDKKYIGTLYEKGDIYLETKYQFYNLQLKHIETKSKKCDLKGALQIFNKIVENKVCTDINLILKCTKVFKENQINDISWFFSVDKNFVIGTEKYTPSLGERAILSIQYALSCSDYDYYIIDEPEMGLSNKYIAESIVPRIINLSKMGKRIILSTHNANIGILTNPINSILKVCNNGKYFTYIGNFYSDKLVNIDDNADIKSWKQESEIYLEGGKDAFEKRSKKYE